MDEKTAYKITVFDYAQMGVLHDAVNCGAYPLSLAPYSVAGAALLQAEGKNILLDTGIDTDDPEKQEWCRNFMLTCRHAKEMLTLVGLKPEDIDTIILSHAHADHAGAVDIYPNAHFYIQRAELEGWEDLFADTRLHGLAIGAQLESDIKRLRALEAQGRLTALDGDVKDLLPDIDIIKTTLCHSFADELVVIRNPEATYVYTGDLCNHPYWLDTSEEHPFFQVNKIFGIGSVYNQTKVYQRLIELVDGDLKKLICPHDNTREDRFEVIVRKDKDLAAYTMN